jgi:dolichol-phosphate mannosyltransferase
MAGDAAPAWSPPTLSIIVPAYQESYNAPILFERVKAVVNGVQWEMTVVDDDSRMEPPMSLLRSLWQTSTLFEACQSLGSRLAGAVIEGWMSSSADFLAAIDGDLQHDESIVLRMYQVLAKGSGNLAIGTRPRQASSGSLSPGAAEAERYRRVGLQANCRDGRYRFQ